MSWPAAGSWPGFRAATSSVHEHLATDRYSRLPFRLPVKRSSTPSRAARITDRSPLAASTRSSRPIRARARCSGPSPPAKGLRGAHRLRRLVQHITELSGDMASSTRCPSFSLTATSPASTRSSWAMSGTAGYGRKSRVAGSSWRLRRRGGPTVSRPRVGRGKIGWQFATSRPVRSTEAMHVGHGTETGGPPC